MRPAPASQVGIVVLFTAISATCGCEPAQRGNRNAQSRNEQRRPTNKADRATALKLKMQQDLQSAKKVVAQPPPEEIRKQLVGAWRIDARFRKGVWKSWHQAGKSQDIEFREDGTLQVYLLTHRMDGTYQTTPGDGCVDVAMSIGKQPYNYAFSITFDDGKLIMSPWERTEFSNERMIKSIADSRAKGSLDRFFRISGFRADE